MEGQWYMDFFIFNNFVEFWLKYLHSLPKISYKNKNNPTISYLSDLWLKSALGYKVKGSLGKKKNSEIFLGCLASQQPVPQDLKSDMETLEWLECSGPGTDKNYGFQPLQNSTHVLCDDRVLTCPSVFKVLSCLWDPGDSSHCSFHNTCTFWNPKRSNL